MNNYTVYKHTSPSGKVYIGITSQTVEQRWKNGNGYTKSKRFNNAIKKYGWDNIQHEILHVGLDKETAGELEKKYIAEYRSCDRRYGYNNSLGGEYGCKITDDVKGKISETVKQRWQEGIYIVNHESSSERAKRMWDDPIRREKMIKRGEKHGMYGKHHSEEARKKIGNVHRGTHHTEEFKQNLSNKLKGENNPNFGITVSEEQRKKISNTLKTYFQDENVRKQSRETRLKYAKSVIQFSIDGEYIATYLGLKEAERQTGVSCGNISRACRGLLKSSGGFKWAYGTE